MPATIPVARLVELARRRPSVEWSDEDGKGLLELDADPARKWQSFHRHLTIVFLVLSWLAFQHSEERVPDRLTTLSLCQPPTSRFSPYDPAPYRSVGTIRRHVAAFLLEEAILWLIQTGRIDL